MVFFAAAALQKLTSNPAAAPHECVIRITVREAFLKHCVTG
jgi:hypothetical protein